MKNYKVIGGGNAIGIQNQIDELFKDGIPWELIRTENIKELLFLIFCHEPKEAPGMSEIIREPINGGTSLKTIDENVGDLLSPLRITWDGEESTYNYITLLLGDSFKYHHYNNGKLLIEGRKSNYEMELDLGWVIDINKDGFSCRDPR